MSERETKDLINKIIITVVSGVMLMLISGVITISAFYYTTKEQNKINDREHTEFREAFKYIYTDIKDHEKRLNKIER